jgi:hypothetical protein
MYCVNFFIFYGCVDLSMYSLTFEDIAHTLSHVNHMHGHLHCIHIHIHIHIYIHTRKEKRARKLR